MLDLSLNNYFAPPLTLSQAALTAPTQTAQAAPTIELVALEFCEAPPLLTREQSLEMFLAMARNSRQPQVMENALGQALRIQRARTAATLSSAMPTAMKIKTCEIPVLKLMLEFGQISPDWRAVIVLMLNDNIDCGSGHLSVNRAKQVLKELAKRAGLAELKAELNAEPATEHATEYSTEYSTERRLAAIVMLGWLKQEKAIEPLVEAFPRRGQREQAEILAVLDAHYKAKLAYFVRWRHADPQAISPRIMQIAV